MNKIRLNACSYAYVFDELSGFTTHVFVIEKEHRIYVVDTFCGPDAMTAIIEDIKAMGEKEWIVINTHFHWDHIWGNCAFEPSQIIGHKLCAKKIQENWEQQILNNRPYRMGEVVMALPQTLVEDELVFEDGIRLFYTPGHTVDSLSIYDASTGLLIVGDNLELPLIYIEGEDVLAYISSLKGYLALNPKLICASHTLIIDSMVIDETITYLELILKKESITFKDPKMNQIHQQNMKQFNTGSTR